MAKEALNHAAFGDLILCYIQNIFAASNQSVDIYDGDFHTIGMDWTGADEGEEGGGPSKVRMKIVKDSGGGITDFVMYACGDNGSEEQTEYLSQTISGSTFSMTEKGVYTGQGDEYHWGSTVGGTLTSTGTFTGTKTVEISFDSTWGSNGSGNGSISWLQQSDSAIVTGFMTGGSSFGEGSFTYEDRFYGALQLIDGNPANAEYNIGLLALGSGCLTGETSGTWESDGFGEDWGETYDDCWNGDTWAVQDNDFSDDIVGAELPEVSTQTADFEGDEVYDCADEVEATLAMADLMSAGLDFDAACEGSQLGQEYIDCWATVQNGAEDDGQGGEEGDGQPQQADLSTFDISQCSGSPSGTDALNQSTGTALCNCFDTIYGAGAVSCDDAFGGICGQSTNTVNDCVTALKAAQ